MLNWIKMKMAELKQSFMIQIKTASSTHGLMILTKTVIWINGEENSKK